MSFHLEIIGEHFLTVFAVTGNWWFSFCLLLIFTHFNFLLFFLHRLDSFVSSADMDLEVVRSGSLELTEVAGIGQSVVD